jgi:hypothetical protein
MSKERRERTTASDGAIIFCLELLEEFRISLQIRDILLKLLMALRGLLIGLVCHETGTFGSEPRSLITMTHLGMDEDLCLRALTLIERPAPVICLVVTPCIDHPYYPGRWTLVKVPIYHCSYQYLTPI